MHNKPRRMALAAEHEGGGRQHRHHPRTDDRRLEAGEHHEPADQRHRDRPAHRRPRPPQERAGGRQEKRHVLAGHGSQVREPAGAEAIDHRRRLLGVVAEHETAEQGGVAVWKRPRPAGKDVADTIRRAIERPTWGDLGHPCQRELSDDVLRGDALSTIRIERIAHATDEHPITRGPLGHTEALGAASRPVLEPFPLHLEHRSRRRRKRLRVADDRGPTLEVPGVARLQSVPGRGRPHVRSTDEQDDHDHEPRRPRVAPDRDQQGRDPNRRRQRSSQVRAAVDPPTSTPAPRPRQCRPTATPARGAAHSRSRRRRLVGSTP